MRMQTLFVASLIVGCGARTGDDFFHPDDDASIDTHVEPPTCPRTLPTAGSACAAPLSCSYPGVCGVDLATCDGVRWGVGGTTCPEKCPPAQPPRGTSCSLGSGTSCAYVNACGLPVEAVCRGGGWAVADPGCETPCPALEPKDGETCGPSPTKCNWTSACGGTDFGGCDGKRWSITVGECPCPGARPAIGAACTSEGQKCSWTNVCKTVDTGVCTTGKWKLDLKPCGTCPLFTPISGSKCGTDAGCKYYLGTDFCTTQCACDGVRWSCGPC